MALPIDATRAVRSRADQQALVRAVHEASPEEQETSYLEWKGPLTLTGRDATGRATIAKVVLGFANRDPGAAARTMGGCAYLLAGVSPSELPGVEAVDAAQLEAQVATYAGRNIDWRADYVQLEGKQVLVVTVEPPQWGDPVHPVRKTFNPSDRRGPVLQEGTVFVRHQASTDRATAADIDMLSRRVARRPGDQLDVEVRPATETKLRAVEVNDQAVEAAIRRENSRLLAPLSAPGAFPGEASFAEHALYGAAGRTGLGGRGSREYRSEEGYREEVSSYLDTLREHLQGTLPARAIMHGVARLRLEVVNNTDTTFTKVQVEVKLSPDVWVTEWQNEVRDQAELPKPPAPYGQVRRSALGYRGFSVPVLSSLRAGAMVAPWRPEVTRRADAVYVDYVPEDVRARGVSPLPSVWMVIADPTTSSVEVNWEATATNAERRLSGTITVPVEQPPVSVEELVAELPEDED